MTKYSMVRAVSLSALATLGVALGAVSPAHAAYPTTPFKLQYGNTVANGTITWYNRSVNLKGTIAVTAGNCRELDAWTYASDILHLDHVPNPETYCNWGSATKKYAFNWGVSANVAGGASRVRVAMYDGPTQNLLTQQTVLK
jgi:hypothetical protein